MSDSAPLRDSADSIELSVPLDSRYTSTLRVVAASIAADCDFTIDEIDDFKLAINEVFSMLVDARSGSKVCVSFVLADRRINVHVAPDRVPMSLQPDQLALNILGAVVDSFEFGEDGVSLSKAATESAGR